MFPYTAKWYEAKIYETRESVPRNEEEDVVEGSSTIWYDDIELTKAKYAANGIDMTKVTRVISTKAPIEFKKNDRIDFGDKTLKIYQVKENVPENRKKAVLMWSNLKNVHAIKTLYLQ